MQVAVDDIRIDKWLWAARFFKTRRAATEAVLGGRVRVNDERVKPAKAVRRADIVEVRVAETRWTVVVKSLAEKRTSARDAANLYEETPDSVADREQHAAERRAQHVPGVAVGARPTKRARRRLDALRRPRNSRGE